ncbi:DUF2017 domain-containing protein [Arthrobacter sp. APC 3897]|uniref:DUF2017 domain-containing protein n=1 Tax=Arthrobacter sp. APC 3897 TaxID=3035204 RepID=UPI0025B56C32|nr:DUF2017 domain-containing protein [Arthrobacter sp. APC 3897]MDN3483419.1 DUF2017 domain-containing protein [Arthrobacter sp. APC 3897]
MATGFKSTRKGISASLDAGERELLRSLFADVLNMLEPETPADADPLAAMVGLDTSARVPDDSALRRLLPDGVHGDDDEALEFRRLTERSLRENKTAALRAASVLLESKQLLLNADQAQYFARALNDVRLVLADRLGLETDEDTERLHGITDPSQARDVDGYLALVYNFITWLQETLMQAMIRSLL